MKIKKLTKTIFLTFILLLCFSAVSFAKTNKITVYVNNEKVDLEESPILENGRVLVPLRGVFEQLGAKVNWNKNIMQVLIKDKNNEIQMMLNKNKVMVNGEIKDIDTELKMINSRTFVPIRFISETLGHHVRWNSNTNSVYITQKESVPISKNNIPTVGSKENLIAILEYNSKLFNYMGTRGISYDTADVANSTAEETSVKQEQNIKNSSDTNEQVEGVHEGDIIKNDGKYIYVKNTNSIKIIDSNPKAPEIISEAYVPENMDINEIFITENKLVVIGDNNFYYKNNDDIQTENIANIRFLPPKYMEERCNVLIYNIEVKEKPILEREYLFDGRYCSARTINDNLYIVTSKYLNIGYEFYDKNINDYDIQLPSYTNCKTNEKVEIPYSQIKYFPNYVDSKYILTAGINLSDKLSKVDVDAYIGSTEAIYVSKDSLYTTVTDFSYNEYAESNEIYNPVYNINTAIYKFNLNNGTITPQTCGEVPGSIINQFSIDEHKNMLRIATTNEVWNTGNNESKNNIYILDKNLTIRGRLENLAPGEKIYSTRFMGDKLYMVTYKTVDPLFVIDTSKPTKPKVLGFLKIPGFSTYLHPIDETHILGFGNDTKQNSWGGTTTSGMKLSLFDVTDVARPKEICTEVIGKSGTHSELLYNHKALMFSSDKEIMAFPISRTTDNYKVDFLGAYVYNVSREGFKLKSKITHSENIKNYNDGINRIIYIDDYLYTFSNNIMQVHDINSDIKISELTIK